MSRQSIKRETANLAQAQCPYGCGLPVLLGQAIARLEGASSPGWGHERCLVDWLAAGGYDASYVTEVALVFRVDHVEAIDTGVGLRTRVNRNLRGTNVRFTSLHELHRREGIVLLYGYVVGENVGVNLVERTARYLVEFFGESVVKVTPFQLDYVRTRKEKS